MNTDNINRIERTTQYTETNIKQPYQSDQPNYQQGSFEKAIPINILQQEPRVIQNDTRFYEERPVSSMPTVVEYDKPTVLPPTVLPQESYSSQTINYSQPMPQPMPQPMQQPMSQPMPQPIPQPMPYQQMSIPPIPPKHEHHHHQHQYTQTLAEEKHVVPPAETTVSIHDEGLGQHARARTLTRPEDAEKRDLIATNAAKNIAETTAVSGAAPGVPTTEKKHGFLSNILHRDKTPADNVQPTAVPGSGETAKEHKGLLSKLKLHKTHSTDETRK